MSGRNAVMAIRQGLRRLVLRLALAGHVRWVHALPVLALLERCP